MDEDQSDEIITYLRNIDAILTKGNQYDEIIKWMKSINDNLKWLGYILIMIFVMLAWKFFR